MKILINGTINNRSQPSGKTEQLNKKTMDKLTTKHVIDNKFTGIDCIKYFKPDVSNEYADDIIWNETCFPFSTEIMINQLNKIFLNG